MNYIDKLYIQDVYLKQVDNMTVVCGNFEWDSEKNELNKKKHGLAFEEIIDAFDDPYFIESIDFNHSTSKETRYIGIGRRKDLVVVLSVYTERDRIRIISSRLATKHEEVKYYEQRAILNGK